MILTCKTILPTGGWQLRHYYIVEKNRGVTAWHTWCWSLKTVYMNFMFSFTKFVLCCLKWSMILISIHYVRSENTASLLFTVILTSSARLEETIFSVEFGVNVVRSLLNKTNKFHNSSNTYIWIVKAEKQIILQWSNFFFTAVCTHYMKISIQTHIINVNFGQCFFFVLNLDSG